MGELEGGKMERKIEDVRGGMIEDGLIERADDFSLVCCK